MAGRAPEDAESARRRFLHHFQNFDPNSRFPAPYTQFAGKPLTAGPDGGWGYDVTGYRNDVPVGPRPPTESLRVFVVGDSTLVDGQVHADTIPGRLETGLRTTHGDGVRVYNFGAIAACLNQMTALITTRLMDLEPDLILVMGGSTDIFLPWSFDPRGGYPFNHFACECLYDLVFNGRETGAEATDLAYDRLKDRLFERLNNLRALTQWQSDLWEWEIVRQFELALRRLARLSPALGAPVRFVLQPTVVRKATRVGIEGEAASGAFLAYLDRQYGRFERVVREIGAGELAGPHFGVRDLSGMFADDARSLFTDIVHTTSAGRQMVAERLQAEIADALPVAAGGWPVTAPIVFVGDSITELWGFHRAETFEAYDLIPRGGSGQTARWITMRFRRDLEETGARGVHLLCGVNDIGRNEGFYVSPEEIARTLTGMLDEARSMGVKAWVGSIMPAARIPWNPEVTDAPAMIAAVNAWLRNHAAEHGATFIDYHSVLATESGALREEYGTDGLHLSPEGYKAIEPLMLEALGRVAPARPGDPAVTATRLRAFARRATGIAVLAAALIAVAVLVVAFR